MRFPVKNVFACSLIALSLGLTGCLTDSKDDETVVTVSWSADTTLNVGAQAHATLGTAIDLDGKKVLLSAAVNDSANSFANLRSVDILFAYSGATLDSIRLMTPKAAKVAGDVALALNYRDSVINAQTTKFVKVTAADTVSWTAGKAKFDSDTTAQKTSSVVAAGDLFVVKTTLNNYILVKVGAFTGAAASTTTGLTIKLKGL